MTLSQLILSQLADPFRIVLLAGLVFTMLRTRDVTGTVVPLLAGAAFVAVIIPVTMGQTSAEPLWRLVASGLVANAVILGVVLGLWKLYTRTKG